MRVTGNDATGYTSTDTVVMPEVKTSVRMLPGTARTQAHLLSWSTHHFTHPPFGAVLHLDAKGERENEYQRASLTLFHHDPYQFAAIAVAACVQQWQNMTTQPRLHFAAHFVEPVRCLRDMERLGLHISGTHWPGSRK